MIEQGIHDLLLADTAVSGLIGNRLYPLMLPEAAMFPAASYQLISAIEQYTLDGPLGLTQARLQIDAWGQTYGSAKILAAAIHAVLNGYDGTLDEGTAVFEIERDQATDGFDPNSRLYRVQSDFMILYGS